MHVVDTAIAPFRPEHLDPAVRLSLQAGWPHRLEDWQMALAISEGFVAVEGDGKVAGTILLTPYGEDCATINMVIVDEAMRGRGLGRRLMDAALTRAADRPLRLTATAEGLPLYRKLGFVETGTVVQHQGIVDDQMVKERFTVELGDVTVLKSLLSALRNVESIFDAYRVTPGNG